MTEQWKDILGYEGLYAISDEGRVYSYYTGKYRKLRQRAIAKDGYLQLNLSEEGKQVSYLVHRLVAQAFIKQDLLITDRVTHIDGNVLNNFACNLAIKPSSNPHGTGFVRIFERSTGRKYQAVINLPSKTQISLGTFHCRSLAEEYLADYFKLKGVVND